MQAPCNKVFEQITRVLGALDGIQRSIERLEEALDSLASTIYADCLLERIDNGKIIRSGLPTPVSFIIKTKENIYVVKAKIVSNYEDAIRTRDLAEKLFSQTEGRKLIPTLVTSKYKSHDLPSGVNIVIC